MKKYFALLGLLILFCLPANAVLKERDLSQTLKILRNELTQSYFEQEQNKELAKARNIQMRQQMVSIMQRSNQNALMLYSQKTDYIFDLTYACHEATEQYNEFHRLRMPFDQVISGLNYEATRYEAMINSLKELPVMILDDKAKIDRNVCMTLATAIYNQIIESKNSYKDDIERYDHVGTRLKELNDYAQKRYTTIQHNIFVNGDETYLTILSRFAYNVREAKQSAKEKYSETGKSSSQWNSAFIAGVFVTIVFYAIIASLLNIIVIRVLMPKKYRTERFLKKRTCIIMASTDITFAILLGIVHATVSQNFIIMASNLLVEYAWLLAVILLSMLFRMEGDQIKSGFRIYTPIIAMGFIVITFRIILIPNMLVNLLFPPILLLCAIWQWSVIMRHNHNIPKSDMFYTWVTLAVLITSVVTSWMGFTLMSVQLLIWWVMLLTCIQTITCLHDWLKKYQKHHYGEDAPVNKVWAFNLINNVMMPIMGVASVLISIYWAADVFDLSELCWRIFRFDFVHEKNVDISIIRLSMVISLYFMFKYFAWLCISALQLRFSKSKDSNAASREVLGKNLIFALIWSIYVFIVMGLLKLGNAWMLVIAGGLSTGIGFASKDILENIYYGISLMAGRITIGDYIECDGTRGIVKSISYTSTMIETDLGSVIAFQNSQLFTKNYKNLTRNHGYELQAVTFGIAYGSNVQMVRELLSHELSKVKGTDQNRKVRIDFAGFGDNSINLKALAWVKVKEMYTTVSSIKETIYTTLQENHVEFPFPQVDLHVKEIPTNNGEQ